jgi:hypothetical protein
MYPPKNLRSSAAHQLTKRLDQFTIQLTGNTRMILVGQRERRYFGCRFSSFAAQHNQLIAQIEEGLDVMRYQDQASGSFINFTRPCFQKSPSLL